MDVAGSCPLTTYRPAGRRLGPLRRKLELDQIEIADPIGG